MPIADPPTHVPWFPEGDPLLPENRDVAVKPLLRLFDPYQTYDALIFSTVNRQLPLGKIDIKGQLVDEEEGIRSGLANPFSSATDHELVKGGYYFLLVERFTPSDAPFADEYVDRLKEICDHFLTLPIDGEFERQELNRDPIPPAIEVEEANPETDIATVTWFYKDGSDLNKREITVNSYEGNPFSWRLSLLDNQPLICPYSVVVTSKTGYLQQLLSGEIKNQCPYLLYQDVADFVQFFKNNFTFGIGDIEEGEDPFRWKDLFFDEYIERFNRKEQTITTFEWEVVETGGYVTDKSIWEGQEFTNPTIDEFRTPIARLNTERALAELKTKAEELGINFNRSFNVRVPFIRDIRWDRIDDTLVFYGLWKTGVFIDSANPRFNGLVWSDESNLVDRTNPEIGQISNVFEIEVEQFPRQLVEGFNSFEIVRRGRIETSVVTEICDGKEIELVNSETTTPFNFTQEDNNIVNWLQELGLSEDNYNFASILRANAYETDYEDTNPKLFAYKIVEDDIEENIQIIADKNSDNVPLPDFGEDNVFRPNVIFLDIEREIEINRDDRETETETFTQNLRRDIDECGVDEEVEKTVKITDTQQLKWRQDHEWKLNQETEVIKDNLLITAIDKHQWEWEVKLDELTGEEVKELSREMPDSIRIKEIHHALDAQKYSKYELNGETHKREANLGYYITRMGALLGINVMPDASPYFPPFAEKVEPDEQGEIDLPDEYGLESFRESTERVDPLRVQNPEFEDYEIEKNNFAYRLQSRMFGEDPNTGEDTRLQEGGFILTHNIPQLIQAILSDLKEALSWEELSASQFNIEDKIRELVTKQFTDPEDEETPEGESLNPQEIQTEGLLNLITAYLAIPYARAGFQDYPVVTPNTLIKQEEEAEYNPGEEGFDPQFETKHQNYSEFYTWLVKQFDAVAGQFPIDINIEDNDLIKLENQRLQLSLPNLAETLAEMMGTNITNQALNNAILSVLLRNLAETGSNRVLNVKQYALQEAMSEYLGYKTGQGKQTVPFTFNPLDVVGDEENPGIESLAKAMESKEIEITVDKNVDGETLEQKLSTLIEAARITKAQSFRTIDAQGNIKEQLTDIIKRGGDFLNNEDEPDDDGKTKFERWLENIEQGFTNEPGVEETDRPYGKDRSRRPKIRKVGEEEQS